MPQRADPALAFFAALAAEQAGGWVPAYATRPLFPWELGTIDFAEINSAQEAAYSATAKSLDTVRTASLDALGSAVEGAPNVAAAVNRYAAIMPPPVRKAITDGTDDIQATLHDTYGAGGRSVVNDARAQGVRRTSVRTTAPANSYRDAAAAGPNHVYNTISRAALTADGPLVPSAAAAMKAATDVSMAGAYDLSRQAVNVSHGNGRHAAGKRLPRPSRIYASELLDGATCRLCRPVDGREYDSIADAEADYPGGAGYRSCEGGHRCRGTLVYVWDEEPGPGTPQPMPPPAPTRPTPPRRDNGRPWWEGKPKPNIRPATAALLPLIPNVPQALQAVSTIRQLLPSAGTVLTAAAVRRLALEVGVGTAERVAAGRAAIAVGPRAPLAIEAAPVRKQLLPGEPEKIGWGMESTAPLTAPADGWSARTLRESYDLDDPQILKRIPEEHIDNLLADAMSTDDWALVDLLEPEVDRRQILSWKSNVINSRRLAMTDEEYERYGRMIEAGWDPYDAQEFLTGTNKDTIRIAELMSEWGAPKGSGWQGYSSQLWSEDQYRRAHEAEDATRGHMLSAEAEAINAAAVAAGKHPPHDGWNLFFGPETTARRWASPELKQWWDENGGRVLLEQWREQQMWGGAARIEGREDYLQ